MYSFYRIGLRKMNFKNKVNIKINNYCLFIFISVAIISIISLLFRNVTNLDFPLSGEFITSPFHSEILNYSLNVWNERFGLGFSNILNSSGYARYSHTYSGAMWLSFYSINGMLQNIWDTFFIHQAVSLLLLSIGIYYVLQDIRPKTNIVSAALLTVSITLIIHSTDTFINAVSSGGQLVAAQGLILISFIQIRRLARFRFQNIFYKTTLIPLALTLSSLLLVFSPYFLALIFWIGIQGVVEFIKGSEKRSIVFKNYLKIGFILITLIIVIYGYVIVPAILSYSNTILSNNVGRHDTPLAISVIDVLRFSNNPVSNNFGFLGTWLQFLLVLIGIMQAFLKSAITRRLAIVDLIVIIILLFLAKGSAPPLIEINQWLHVNIPLFRIMGSSYPYLGPIFALLIYYLIYGICSLLDITKNILPRIGGLVAFIIIVLTLVIAVFRNDAYLSGDFGGRVQSIDYPSEYYEFKKVAESVMLHGRAYYFPDEDARIGMDFYYSPINATIPMGCCYDLPFSSLFPININWSNFYKYSGYYGQTMSFLMKHFHSADEIAGILSAADTKYLVFDISLKKNVPAADRMYGIRDKVRTSKLFEYRSNLSNRYIEVYENLMWRTAPQEIKNITLATDDPTIYLNAVRSKVNLYNESIIVSGATSISDALDLKKNNILKKVLLFNSSKEQLMLDMVRTPFELKPDYNFIRSYGKFWYTLNSVYQQQLTEKDGGRFLGRYSVASSSEGAKTPYLATMLPDISNKLFIRAWVSPDSGRLWVRVNGDQRQLNLRSNEYVGLQWFYLGDAINSTGKINVEIESLDVGRHKNIDAVVLIPEKKYLEFSEIMDNFFNELNINQVQTNDYLQWKKYINLGNLNILTFKNVDEFPPKLISITHNNFKLHENFNNFGNIVGDEHLNLIEQVGKNNSKLYNSKELNFSKIYVNKFVAMAGSEQGIYSIKYELASCEPFSELTLKLRTAYASKISPLNIYVSDNALLWTKIGTRTTDDIINDSLDLTNYTVGKKKIYLKLSYEKVKPSESIYITDLVIRGRAGQENMNCKVPRSNAPTFNTGFKALNSDGDLILSSNYAGYSENNDYNKKSILLFNKGFDPNWQLEDAKNFNINYGFTAFSKSIGRKLSQPSHSFQKIYKILIFVSFIFYIFLLTAVIWLKINPKHLFVK